LSRHLITGRRGEDLAAEHLTGRGFRLIERNVRTPYGEIDLVMLDGRVVVFVEVKARTSQAFGRPGEAVGPVKRRHLSKAALSYLARRGWHDRRARFDVVAVIMDGAEARLDHLADAFDLVLD